MKYDVKDTQKVIERFGIQSFAIKGFSFTFLGLILPTVYEKENIYLTGLAVIAVIIFWCLDSFYLKMEKIYRGIEDEGISHGMNYKKYPDIIKMYPLCKVVFTKTLLPIYIIQILFIIISCNV